MLEISLDGRTDLLDYTAGFHPEAGPGFPFRDLTTPCEDVIHTALLQVAARQFGIVSRCQLDELGCSNAQLSRARRSGLIDDVTSRTIRVRSSPDTFLARAMAVSLHLGERGFLSGTTAGRLHGLREMPDHPICATVPAGDRPKLPAWVDVRSTTWYDPHRHRRRLAGGVVVAEPHRMLYDLAARLDDGRFQRAAEDCWHLRLVSPRSAAAYLRSHRRQGKDGTLRMERWLEAALEQDRPAESGLELDLLAALCKVGLPEPRRQYRLELRTGQQIHVDLAWPDLRLCVEPGHSWWHGGDDAMRRDQARVLGALSIGWQTIQLDESLRRDPAQAAELIRDAYRERAALIHPDVPIVPATPALAPQSDHPQPAPRTRIS